MKLTIDTSNNPQYSSSNQPLFTLKKTSRKLFYKTASSEIIATYRLVLSKTNICLAIEFPKGSENFFNNRSIKQLKQELGDKGFAECCLAFKVAEHILTLFKNEKGKEISGFIIETTPTIIFFEHSKEKQTIGYHIYSLNDFSLFESKNFYSTDKYEALHISINDNLQEIYKRICKIIDANEEKVFIEEVLPLEKAIPSKKGNILCNFFKKISFFLTLGCFRKKTLKPHPQKI